VGQNTTEKVEQSKEITADGDIFALKLALQFPHIILKTGQLSFVSIDQ
jgi:hypothetical protein